MYGARETARALALCYVGRQILQQCYGTSFLQPPRTFYVVRGSVISCCVMDADAVVIKLQQ
ncbi:hypothetical protein DPMN_085317 [Dreissena polymorpha]|uniref:Uncharacterized protein n=1 Tax=Dreissena polymorpha TaxID=45954 RepID=A0A9D4BK54_DREPO|nr:hypothetical protein DPMN_085317 [Dreissena polymorpha]